MDRGAWWAIVHGVAKSWPWLSEHTWSRSRSPVEEYLGSFHNFGYHEQYYSGVFAQVFMWQYVFISLRCVCVCIYIYIGVELLDSLVAQTVKCLPAVQKTKVRSRVEKIPWRRKWQPTPMFLPGESHRQRSLMGYSPWGHKELDTIERISLSIFFFFKVPFAVLGHKMGW